MVRSEINAGARRSDDTEGSARDLHASVDVIDARWSANFLS
jgi:hypothetical protein